jgi:hypothetical protein
VKESEGAKSFREHVEEGEVLWMGVLINFDGHLD